MRGRGEGKGREGRWEEREEKGGKGLTKDTEGDCIACNNITIRRKERIRHFDPFGERRK